jgi:hypothetical protein
VESGVGDSCSIRDPRNVCPSRAELDRGSYPTGIKVTDEQLATVSMPPDEFHGEWNDSIQPENREERRIF